MTQADAPREMDEKTLVRRNRLAGLWAAELLGLIGQAAKDYAHDLAHHHQTHPAKPEECGVVRKLSRDLAGKVSHSEIIAKLTHFLHLAHKEDETGSGNAKH